MDRDGKRGTANEEIIPGEDANIGETAAKRSDNLDRLRFLYEQVFQEQLRDIQVEQVRKQVLVIRWFRMEGPSLNG